MAPTHPIDTIVEQLKGAVSAPKLIETEAFVRTLYAHTPDEELAENTSKHWSELALSLLKFWRERKLGEAKVRVFNPTRDEHGWESSHTVIQVVNDDMPFLVDSTSIAIQNHKLMSHLIIHPVLMPSRDPGGNLLDIAGGDASRRESIMHFEVDRIADASAIAALRADVQAAVAAVRACVMDFKAMKAKAISIADELTTRKTPHDAETVAETSEYLRWIAGDQFTFLGYREYRAAKQDGREVLQSVPGSGLGILRSEEAKPSSRPTAHLAARDLESHEKPSLAVLSKTNARSIVHHAGYMDYIGILAFDEAGIAVSEQRFLGLYTSSAITTHPWEVPLIRKKIAEVQSRAGLNPTGHSGKALLHVLEGLPRDELHQASVEELTDLAVGILNLQERQRSKLFVRRDRFGRSISCLVFIPRDRMNTEIRERVEGMLKRALHGERTDSSVQMSESALARLHIVVRPKVGDKPAIDLNDLQAKLTQIVRNWQDELRDTLVQRHGEEKGLKLTQKYGRALPAGYIESSTPFVAANDVELAAALKSTDDIKLSLYRNRKKSEGTLRFKLFKYNNTIALSDALPLLENMGLRVLSEHPYEMALAGENIWIQDFEAEVSANPQIDVEALKDSFSQAFEQAWRGQIENDGFNKLVLGAGLNARQVSILRAFCKYLLQTKLAFSQSYIESAVNAHPLIARLLIELFEAKFDPTRDAASKASIDVSRKQLKLDLDALLSDAQIKNHPDLQAKLLTARSEPRAKQTEAAHQAIQSVLNDVQSLDEDRILRAYLQLIDATLRTNAFQVDEDSRPKAAMSFKLNSSKVPELPKPIPYREIFVYSPRVEGVHLRFGKVARGGLRWSDRKEDFRTEVLGLVKAQQVKNTVIVPVGAKGGFYVKRPAPANDRDAVLAEGIACYRIFIASLLDITDNVVSGRLVAPANVVRHDEDDPYLVVAADKGTATFSDIANAISLEYGHWLGDAFASGGSKGYDHKKMGITAKGGWESVKRHFRELGKDCQTEEFTCVGIGDMSGDVFGNGMLLSRKIKLLAAFDHRHFFIDPNPDCEVSFIERERMFNLPRSSWDDYNKALISQGGGIFPRSAKSIALSSELKAVLGIDADISEFTPNQLMQAILKAPVELLWNGGIGTYVKSERESHADVGDRANNAIRVNGRELRCKVVGEGGNLGCTQLGRVEFALLGGLLNTDFIDNSAGVDTSDHEVNIKILLNEAQSAGELDSKARDALLVSMTDEVGEMVIYDNYRQNLAVSLMQAFGASRLGAKQHFIRTLESQGLLDRAIEFLPSEEEFAERKARRIGLTRPELSTLLSYAKLVLYQQLLDSEVPEDPYLKGELALYFPSVLREKYAGAMERHRLKREIIATQVTNSVVNRMGSTFVLRMQEDTGATPAKVAKAFTIARDVTQARNWWADLDDLNSQVPGKSQLDAHVKIWNLLRNLTRWLLNLPGGLTDIAALVSKYSTGTSALLSCLEKVLPNTQLKRIAEEAKDYTEQGFTESLAQTIARLNPMAAAFDVIEVASRNNCGIERAAKVYFDLGDALHLKWLQDQIEKLPVEGRWHANARGVMRDELFAQHRALASQLLASAEKRSDATVVPNWLSSAQSDLAYTMNMFNEMRASAQMDYATMSVAIRRLAQLVGAGNVGS